MRLRILGIQPYRRTVRRDRLDRAIEGVEYVPSEAVCLAPEPTISAAMAQCALDISQRAPVVFANCKEHARPLEIRIREVRLNGDRPVEASHCRGNSIERRQDLTLQQESTRTTGSHPEGSIDDFECPPWALFGDVETIRHGDE